MPLKIYKLLLKVSSVAALFSFFIIASNMYFPFITGKQIYFNIVVEFMMVLWMAMVVKFPETRPKKS